MIRLTLPSSAPAWREQRGVAPWADTTEPLLADAPADVRADYADALYAEASSASATAHLPLDMSVRIGDAITATVDDSIITGAVTTVEHVVRDGQALTRVEMRVKTL